MIKYPYVFTCYAIEGGPLISNDEIKPIGSVYVRAFTFEEAEALANDCLTGKHGYNYFMPFISTIRRFPSNLPGCPLVFKNTAQRVLFKPYTEEYDDA